MAYTNATVANNAQGTLLAGISAAATSVVLNAGQGGLFPSTFPFYAKIEQYDTALNNYRVLKREIVKVTGRTVDTLTIVRGAGNCPSAYNSTTQTSTAFSFSANDTITHVLTAEQVKDIQDNLLLAATETEIQNQSLIYATAAGWTNAYTLTLVPVPAVLQTWQRFVFKANAANTGAATLNVNSLWANTIKKLGGSTDLTSNDILNGQIVEVEYDGTNFQMQTPPGTLPMSTISGEIRIWGGKVAPSWFLLCNGAAISRATYAALFSALNPSLGTITVTIATPGVVTLNAHGMATGDSVYLTTTGALPTGLAINTRYWVVKVDANTFSLATSLANALAGTKIATSGTQSGVHTMFYSPWGNGDGTTTFNLPNMNGLVAVGKDQTQVEFAGVWQTGGEKTHLLTGPESGIQAHTHTFGVSITAGGIPGAGANNTSVNANSTTGTAGPTNATNAHNNIQPYVTVNYIVAQ